MYSKIMHFLKAAWKLGDWICVFICWGGKAKVSPNIPALEQTSKCMHEPATSQEKVSLLCSINYPLDSEFREINCLRASHYRHFLSMRTEAMSVFHWKDGGFYSQDSCIGRVHWEALFQYASSRNSGEPCTVLPISTMGGVHLIILLGFNNTKWITRIQLALSIESSASLFRAEIGAMELFRARTKIPMPRIFGYELDDTNDV